MKRKLRTNLVDIFVHCIVAAFFVSIIYSESRDLYYVLIFLVGGILIDLDHLIDHFLFFKNRFNTRSFFSSAHLKSGKVYLLFHSWELNLIVLLLGAAFNSKGLMILSAGLSAHLAVDTIVHRKILFYFIIFRMVKNFDLKKLCPESPYCTGDPGV